MNNRQLVSLFFGLGFLVLAAGIFTSQMPTNNQNRAGIQPQTINQNRSNITPNAINDTIPNTTNNNSSNKTNDTTNKIDTNNSVSKIKTELDKIDGVDNVDAVVSNKCALISCNVSKTLRNQQNFKETLTKKVKEIDPNLVTVYIMENQDMQNTDFKTLSNQFMSSTENEFKTIWQNLTNSIQKR